MSKKFRPLVSTVKSRSKYQPAGPTAELSENLIVSALELHQRTYEPFFQKQNHLFSTCPFWQPALQQRAMTWRLSQSSTTCEKGAKGTVLVQSRQILICDPLSLFVRQGNPQWSDWMGSYSLICWYSLITFSTSINRQITRAGKLIKFLISCKRSLKPVSHRFHPVKWK